MDVSYQLHALVTLPLKERTPCSYWLGECEGHWVRSELWRIENFTPSRNRTTVRRFPYRYFDPMGGGDKDNYDNDVEKKREGRVVND